MHKCSGEESCDKEHEPIDRIIARSVIEPGNLRSEATTPGEWCHKEGGGARRGSRVDVPPNARERAAGLLLLLRAFTCLVRQELMCFWHKGKTRT
jgi:hypothetical protein